MGVLLALGMLTCVPAMAAEADDKDEMVTNPKYKFWANFKPGATAVHVERNVLKGEDKDAFPDGVDEKVITYKLLSVTKSRVIVQVVVVEREYLGTVESAPTKATYPARIKKAHLAAVLAEFGAKLSDKEETVKVGKADIKCKVLKGSQKKGDEVTDFKLCFSEEVPGGIVKRTRTAKQGDKTIAETTITVRSFADGGADKKLE
jgi:hypothetical protein